MSFPTPFDRYEGEVLPEWIDANGHMNLAYYIVLFDYATDARLRSALATEVTDATMIIVAQRVATIRHAHQILVLDAGRIVARGTHDELMDSSETYREIVLSQLTEQEAAA